MISDETLELRFFIKMIMLVLIIIFLIIIMVKVYDIKNTCCKGAKENMQNIVGNPGCAVDEQAACSQGASGGSCPAFVMLNGKQLACTACDDFEGEGCVPSNCASTACMSSNNDPSVDPRVDPSVDPSAYYDPSAYDPSAYDPSAYDPNDYYYGY